MANYEAQNYIVTNGLVLNLDAGDPDSYTRSQPPYVEVLVVAGGGGGAPYAAGGGGGAGGVIYNSAYQLSSAAAITVTVGAGGNGGVTGVSAPTQGSNSVFGSLTSVGGGRGGGGWGADPGGNGGSGGGGGGYDGSGGTFTVAGGTGTAGQGNNGGLGRGISPNRGAAGGGGGAGQVGGDSTTNSGGNGGNGSPFSISGTSTYYGGGGGGGDYGSANGGQGGLGGGGNVSGGNGSGIPGYPGTANTGGGGGGSRSATSDSWNGGNGGSGIVIVRYPGLPASTGGTITYLNGYTIHTFTTSGTFTPYLWNDITGNGNNGTLVNGVGFNSYQSGGYLSFDGVDDRVIITPPTTYSEYTIYFFCKWISSVGFSERLFGCDAFGTYTIFNPYDVGFHYNPLGGVPSSVVLASGVNVGFGAWCQVAVTVSTAGSNVVIYVNGIARNSWSVLPAANLSANIFVGAQNSSLFANCQFGNFQLYNRALSAAEITQNFNAQRNRFGI
jgi:hypothetical protein